MPAIPTVHRARELLCVVLLLSMSASQLLAQAESGAAMDSVAATNPVPTNADLPTRLESDAQRFRVRVLSDWQLDPAAAKSQASQRLREVLLSLIVAETKLEFGSEMPPQDDALWPSLLLATDVVREDHLETTIRPYGQMQRQAIFVTLPRTRLTEWTQQHVSRMNRRHFVQQARRVGIVCGSLVLLVIARRGDRRTFGYRRSVWYGSAACGIAILSLLVATF